MQPKRVGDDFNDIYIHMMFNFGLNESGKLSIFRIPVISNWVVKNCDSNCPLPPITNRSVSESSSVRTESKEGVIKGKIPFCTPSQEQIELKHSCRGRDKEERGG